MINSIHNQVGQSLSGKPMKGQPVGANVSVDMETPDGKKVNSKEGMGNTKIKSKNAFNPRRSYTVEVINKARAKMGGH